MKVRDLLNTRSIREIYIIIIILILWLAFNLLVEQNLVSNCCDIRRTNIDILQGIWRTLLSMNVKIQQKHM